MTAIPDRDFSVRDARAQIAEVARWYHCIEVAPDVVTPGWFDLRGTVEQLPWPDVRGKRCLDVGTSDGFLAFELERRGAAEVLATDIAAHEQWDWEREARESGLEYLRHVEGQTMGAGLRVARELRGSAVEVEHVSVYDLSPETVGEFDIVLCGSLLLHLRDPLRALAAIRSVCKERFLSTNQVDVARSVVCPRQPLVRLDGTGGITQWWIPNVAGHRQLLRAAGFEIEAETGLYSVAFGPAHTPRSRSPRWLVPRLARQALTGSDGVPHHAALTRPG